MGKKSRPPWHLHDDLLDCGTRRWMLSAEAGSQPFYLVDEPGRNLLRGATPVPIEPRPFDMLMIFIRRHARVVAKEELRTLLWGDRAVSDHVLTKCVSKLRMAFEDAPGDPRPNGAAPGRPLLTAMPVSWLATVYGSGYRLTVSPHPVDDEADPGAATSLENRQQIAQWLARQGGLGALPPSIRTALEEYLPAPAPPACDAADGTPSVRRSRHDRAPV